MEKTNSKADCTAGNDDGGHYRRGAICPKFSCNTDGACSNGRRSVLFQSVVCIIALGSIPRSQEKRLRQVQEELTRIIQQQARPFCNCRTITVACHGEDFAREIETPCPIHGQRWLGSIVYVTQSPIDGDPNSERIIQLVREYNRRWIRAEVNNE